MVSIKNKAVALSKVGLTVKEIATSLNTWESYVYKILKEAGVSANPPTRVGVYKDKDVSRLANPETQQAAYYIGYLFADGFIDVGEKSVNIKIHKKDVDILYGLAEFVNLPRVAVRTTKSGYVELSICSKELVQELKKYNIIRNKTKNANEGPIFDDQGLQLAALRGWFDGDGYIGRQAILTSSNEAQAKSFSSIVGRLGGTGTVFYNDSRASYGVRLNKHGNQEFMASMFALDVNGLDRKKVAYFNTYRTENEGTELLDKKPVG